MWCPSTIGDFETLGSLGSFKPYSKNATELFIRVSGELEHVSDIMSLVARHKVSVVNLTLYAISQYGYGMISILEFDHADCDSDELIQEIKKYKEVIRLESHKIEGSLFGKFGYPLLVMGKYRAIMIRTTPLLQIEHRLSESFGTAGPSIMFEEGKAYASAVIDQYVEALPGLEGDDLLPHIIEGWHATGWGMLDIKRQDDQYFVTLSDSPVFWEPKVKESRFLYGMVAGIIHKIYAKDTIVVNSMVDTENKRIKLILKGKV